MRNWRYLAAVLLFCFFLLPILSAQIINIEDRRGQFSDTTGLTGALDIGFNFAQNGKEILGLTAAGQLGYYRKSHQIFLIGNFNRQVVDRVEINDIRSIHLRFNQRINRWMSWEAFVQGQHHRNLKINFRGLVGSGPRFPLLEQDDQAIYTGILYMYEYDDLLETDLTFRDHRLSVYLSFRFQPWEQVRFSSTTYFQPILNDDFRNFRLSSKSSLEVEVTKNLSFLSSFSFSVDRKLEAVFRNYPLPLTS